MGLGERLPVSVWRLLPLLMTSDLMLVEGPPKRWPLLRRVCIYYRTAKTFGLKSYHAVLLRADKVIDRFYPAYSGWTNCTV